MFEPIDKIQGHVLGIRITGEISEDEHLKIDAMIRTAIAKWGRLRILIVVKHYPSFSSAEALYEDLRMVKKNAEHIQRMAIVGDRQWKSTWVGIFGLFSGIETNYFQLDQVQEAWQWINE